MASGGRLIASVLLLFIASTSAGASAHHWHAGPLPEAKCPGRDFSAVVEAECGRVTRGWVLLGDGDDSDDGDDDDGPKRVFVEWWRKGSRRAAASRGDCERAVTARELQRNIVDASDARCVAQILVQTGSVGGIEEGLRIDPDFNFRPTCGARGTDPDVVAMKSIALAILAGGRGDEELVAKIVDGLVPSLTPPGERGDSQLPSCATHPPPCAPCRVLQDHPPLRKGDHTKDHSINRTAVLGTLSDRALMLKVLDEDPNLSRPCVVPRRPVVVAKGSGGDDDDDDNIRNDGDEQEDDQRRRLLRRLRVTRGAGGVTGIAHEAAPGGRRLQCADCDNADSFPCAYCWQQDVCGDMYWCQDHR